MSRVAAVLSRRLSALVEVRTDGQLLAAFLADRDEAAFAELVRRHGPLVWGACRRLLPDPADAEDAFQATFLVLVRRSHRLTGQAAVGPWLYRVAAWTARNARRKNARSLARRQPLSPAAADPSPGVTALDDRADLDAALLALPEKYRTPLVLCHLQGWTRRDAAAALGCPEGTLSSLLSRGLDRLRHLLRSHDPARLLTLAGAGVPAALAANTVRAAVGGKLAAAGVVSSAVSQLVEGVVHMFWVKKATAAVAALCVVFGTGIGVGVSVRPVPGLADDGSAASREVAADLGALRAEVAAAEDALKAADEGVRLAREKIKLTQGAGAVGQFAAAEVLQDKLTLVRFEENAANARGRRPAALARLKAAEQPANVERGLFELADKPTPPTAADLDLLRAELAAAEDALKAATEGVRLVKEKVELVRKQADRGAVSKTELLDSEITLTRFQENAANARQKQQALVAKLRAAEKQWKEKPDAAKPAAGQDQQLGLLRLDAETVTQQAELLARQMDELKLEQALLEAEAEQLAARRAAVLQKLAALERQKKDAAPPRAVEGNFLFHLTVGGKDAAWPFLLKEYGPDGVGVGTAAFDNPAVLAKYLARVAKSVPAGTGVRILAPKDAPAEWVKAAADAVRAVRLGAEVMPAAEAQRIDDFLLNKYRTDDLLRNQQGAAKQLRREALDEQRRDALMEYLGGQQRRELEDLRMRLQTLEQERNALKAELEKAQPDAPKP
jgi:RNA polymerase sigma factor (sigma-70 family)